MGQVKEKCINNLTKDEIDELYSELMYVEHFYIEEEGKQIKC